MVLDVLMKTFKMMGQDASSIMMSLDVFGMDGIASSLKHQTLEVMYITTPKKPQSLTDREVSSKHGRYRVSVLTVAKSSSFPKSLCIVAVL